jgi:BirA family transcriptional regulator, biotin operon repressor / biotin---[acetyl-CoA-carboxylase] ligase
VSSRAPWPARTPGARLGRPRVHLRLTDSTNDRARELAMAGAPHGTLVSAAEQSAGRGRGGRRWSAPAGSSILMSLVLREPPALLPLIAAVAVCAVAGERAMIKWPNDVVVFETPIEGSPDGGVPVLGKLAGILTEARPQEGWAVLGIGLNVAVRLHELPAELQAGAAGPDARVAATLGLSESELEPVLARLLAALELGLAAPQEQTLEQWRARDALSGREISWNGGHGRARGIDGLGRLVVALPDGGQQALSAGEVHLEQIV